MARLYPRLLKGHLPIRAAAVGPDGSVTTNTPTATCTHRKERERPRPVCMQPEVWGRALWRKHPSGASPKLGAVAMGLVRLGKATPMPIGKQDSNWPAEA
ncbi:hypothetical protein PG997_009455 [Apiospora hydei]|uniref:Uncharacterized protein n=1 Tax=Apiospora hydei TaxID=1337664 RepID=A0ABR1VU98_9PEZI